jgi:ABC-2 type transport system ATP-binding protein
VQSAYAPARLTDPPGERWWMAGCAATLSAMSNRSVTDPGAGWADADVAVQSVVKSYRSPDGPVLAVRGVDVSIGRGETVALLGPNGAGKSTTLDILLGLTEPDAGAVSIFGMRPHAAIAAGRVGAMLQTGALIHDLSVREVVAMIAALYSEPLAVDDVLELTGLRASADKRTQKLSGGQAQRVRLALALVSDPDLLVLDEPTVSLDVEARRDFWTTMRSFAASGKTVIFATYYLDEADAYADRRRGALRLDRRLPVGRTGGGGVSPR